MKKDIKEFLPINDKFNRFGLKYKAELALCFVFLIGHSFPVYCIFFEVSVKMGEVHFSIY